MKVEDLVIILNNRLREFKLSKDYARMRGDLERMNAADEEIISLEDTLFQLNLLVDASKSEEVKESILAGALRDGSTSVLGEYDITTYATDPEHEIKVMTILSKMPVMDTIDEINDYIKGKYPSSPVTGEMIMSAAKSYEVDVRLMMAIMEQDSRFGTAGVAVRTLNPGNVGNDDAGNIRTYESWQEGVTAVAEWLSRHRGSTITPVIPEEDSSNATSTATSTVSGVGTITFGSATSTNATSTNSGIDTGTGGNSTSTNATSTNSGANTGVGGNATSTNSGVDTGTSGNATSTNATSTNSGANTGVGGNATSTNSGVDTGTSSNATSTNSGVNTGTTGNATSTATSTNSGVDTGTSGGNATSTDDSEVTVDDSTDTTDDTVVEQPTPEPAIEDPVPETTGTSTTDTQTN